MPWAIWSPEDFPKRHEEGYLVDYCQAYRIQVILEANKWNMLAEDGFYRDEYCQSWVDKQADLKEVTITAHDVAQRICRDKGRQFPVNGPFYSVGLMFCNTDRTSKEEMKKLEDEGKRRNEAFRKKVVEAFEVQFAQKMRGEPGRLTPDAYEKECYASLGMTPPEVVHRPQPAAPQTVIVQPDANMISQLVSAEVEKRMAELTAPESNS